MICRLDHDAPEPVLRGHDPLVDARNSDSSRSPTPSRPGSSIMPQKKNPDVAELIRGKTGRVYGDLMAILTILKGLPMTYNRDLQEDKEPLFDAVDTVKGSLAVLAGMAGNIRFNRQRMLEEASKGFSTATDLAEYLVKKGVPFRKAHEIVGRLVADCIRRGKELGDLDLESLRGHSARFRPGRV